MHARKIRYDDSFIAEEEQKDASETAQVTSVGPLSASHVPSPARQLQQQLEEQFSDSVAIKPIEKYSGLSSISIIVGSCSIFWVGVIALGLFIYQ